MASIMPYKDKNTLRLYRAKYQLARRNKKKLELLEFLGGKCAHCGFNDHRALQIDHVYGGGCKEWYGKHQEQKYKMVYKNPKSYQLLCANCNWIKRFENQETR